MGGTVGVTFRFEDGKVEPMARWTNSLPWFFQHTNFINKSRQHLKDYLRSWYLMKEDWNENHVTGNFKYNVTDKDASWRFVAPIGYGLVVIDYKTDTILTMQGYCHPAGLSAAGISIAYRHEPINELIDQYWPLVKDGRFSYLEDTGRRKVTEKDRKIYEGDSFVDFAEWCKKHAMDIHSERLDMSPWTIIAFPESIEGADAFRAKLKELDFKLSAFDIAKWEQWHQDQLDEDEADV